MNCRDVREVGDSYLSEELLTETNQDVLRHLNACPLCRAELDARRRLRAAVRMAFHRAPDLQPRLEFAGRLRGKLHESAVHRHRSSMLSRRWLALAAGLVLVTGLTAGMFLKGSASPADALARDAIGSHRDCALKFRLVRTPMPLEEAAHRFDAAYRLLLSAPPDDIATPEGPARVVDRHACAYGTRRFGHVVMEYRGRIVSLLMTADDAAESIRATPHVIGHPAEGLSAVSVNGSRHAIVLVGDLGSSELTHLSTIVSLPLVQRVGSLIPDRRTPTSLPITQPALAFTLASQER